jgi:CBS domain-containing protein
MLIVNILQAKGEKVYSIAADATLEMAAKELAEKRVGAVVVLGPDGALAGVLSERDIVREISRSGAKSLDSRVSAAMTKMVVTAAPEESVDALLARMTDRRVRHLPVLSQGRLVGIVSIGDLVKRKIEEVEAHAAAMQHYISAG